MRQDGLTDGSTDEKVGICEQIPKFKEVKSHQDDGGLSRYVSEKELVQRHTVCICVWWASNRHETHGEDQAWEAAWCPAKKDLSPDIHRFSIHCLNCL